MGAQIWELCFLSYPILSAFSSPILHTSLSSSQARVGGSGVEALPG